MIDLFHYYYVYHFQFHFIFRSVYWLKMEENQKSAMATTILHKLCMAPSWRIFDNTALDLSRQFFIFWNRYYLDGSWTLSFLLCILVLAAGIVLFLLVEKLVRYVEENSGGANSWGHGHHHHNHNSKKKLKDDNNSDVNNQSQSSNTKKSLVDEGKEDNQVSHDTLEGDKPAQSKSSLRKVKWGCHYSFGTLLVRLE